MQYESDPYFQGKLAEMQTNFLNFSGNMAATNPDTYVFSGNAYSLRVKTN